MSAVKRIKTALISVFYKDNLDAIAKYLSESGVEIYSTGGTLDFIAGLGIKARSVESLTGCPSIFGGRVKTLHHSIFGGILFRRDNDDDRSQAAECGIPEIDLVIVDPYPFEEAVKSGASDEEITEKIDIGGISLIRAGAKNFKDVLTVSSRDQYSELLDLLKSKNCSTDIEDRRKFAGEAFKTTSDYDAAIAGYFGEKNSVFSYRIGNPNKLRYGENPHQQGVFYGKADEIFDRLWGKEISYNNYSDIDSASELISTFEKPAYAVIKHGNACGCAEDDDKSAALRKALAGDPVSAFGGVIVTNRETDKDCAEAVDKLFFEIIMAPAYTQEALNILKSKKNRIILKIKQNIRSEITFRSILNGVLVQEADSKIETAEDLNTVTKTEPDAGEIEDLLFANKLVKHLKSNAIVLVKNKQLLACGTGQTSRVDALKQAITKAKSFGFSLKGAVMASDAFFPFPDCIDIASSEGITAVVQPGGSIKDGDSIDLCNERGVSMVFTGFRHFKH